MKKKMFLKKIVLMKIKKIIKNRFKIVCLISIILLNIYNIIIEKILK